MIEPPSDSEPSETGKWISTCLILKGKSNNHDAPLFVTLLNRVGNNSHRLGKSSALHTKLHWCWSQIVLGSPVSRLEKD